MKLRFALGIIYRAKSWTMRSVADAKWSATRNSSVASCYQPSSCLVDDDFHLGSLSSVVKCPGDPRLPIAVCGHAASGAERPLPVWASTRRLPGYATKTDPLCQRRTPFRIGRRGDWVISWQLPPDAIPRGFEPVSDADMPAEHLAEKPAFETDDMVVLHRSLDRDSRHQRRRRRRALAEATERPMYRRYQSRNLINADTILRDITPTISATRLRSTICAELSSAISSPLLPFD